jgi:hypothetical protein
MIRSILKAVIINAVLVAILFFICVVTGFLLGYADTGDHDASMWLLYSGFVFFHLLVNLLFVTPPKKNHLSITIGSSMFILVLYGIIALIYR